MDKKNTMLLTVIAVATLLVAVVGATFAYFSVTGTNRATSTVVETTAEQIGIVTLTDTDTDFYLNLTAAQMAEKLKGSKYYASTEDVTALDETNKPAAANIATVNVTGGESEIVYYCTFNYTVTVDPVAPGERWTDDGVNAPTSTTVSESDILELLGNDSALTLSTDVKNAEIELSKMDFTLGTTNGVGTGKVKLTGAGAYANIKALVEFTNTDDTATQNNLSGATIKTNVDIADFVCDTYDIRNADAAQ